MSPVILTPDDLAPFADIPEDKAQAMIDDATAIALHIAPCLDKDPLDPAVLAVAKAVLRGAVLRWDEQGTGAAKTTTVGPFGQTIDSRTPRKGMFLPSELDELKSLCGREGLAFSVDTAPGNAYWHLPWCNLLFGATYCSCGTDVAGHPIYELLP